MLQVRSGYSLLGGQPFLQRVFAVAWLGPPKNVRIVYNKLNSVSKELTVLLNVTDTAWFGSIAIKWSLEGTNGDTANVVNRMDKAAAFLNSDNKIKFIVAKNRFTRSGQYRVRLRLYSKQFNNVQVYEDTVVVDMLSGPYSGGLSIDRQRGTPFVYEFTIRAQNWRSRAQPATIVYQYFYANQHG